MKIYEFPFEFERSAEKNLQAAISTREALSVSRINDLRSSIKKEPVKAGIAIFSSLGSIGGLIACTCVSCSGDIFGSTILGDGILTLIIWVVVAVVLGSLIDFAVQKAWDSKKHEVENSIEYETRNRDEYIKNITHECEVKCKKYTAAFEKATQEMSVQYAASSLAQSVISWMTDGFCRTIDVADRRPHIELINVPFVFDVYPHKITCNLGTFDFELQRCRNLNSPLEQAALARAIASSMQLNIVKKYHQDVTGSSVDVSISFSYAQNRPIVTVSYVAQNFNYKPVANWEDVVE